MSVYIPIPIAEVVQEREPPSRTYRLDLTRGRIYGYVDGLDAVNQFIRKTLITPRFRCLIYDNQYGSEIKQTVVADDATPELIESELPRIVKDALLADSRILDVYDFSFAFDGDRCAIKFGASTVFGETVIEEVM
jgi:hypothetical protein